MNNLEAALDAHEKGYTCIPILPGLKIPALRWRRWQTERPTPDLYRLWFEGTRNGIALITAGMVVFDVDDFEKAKLVIEECGDTPHKLKTPRGLHLGYRKRKGVEVKNLVRIKGQPIDIRTDGGLEIIPPSATEHGEYAWIGDGLRPVEKLPVAVVGWTRERTRRRMKEVVIDETDARIRRARAYIASIEGAISGQGGHRQTFRVAVILRQKFDLSFEEAWPLLKEWNEQCEPPWDDAALIHKLKDAGKPV